ncbi:GNAT family N-acetyltransferase [Streptomyces sp. 549]|uniref:GNAT family N-acetyltransferase n=1 Tax=Streptomyces sp. 549 TaxID=3049076 RepID=UPI0024C4683F|nr:GNAT family N-acetyltransferase [Streptomyces sp. 549]MDK1472685.1 GNAT family N-acetyltransferase [Streptomyces sp. 549]
MAGLTVAHTAQLDTAELAAVRALLTEAFDGDFDDHDWDHGLGGMHVLAREGGRTVGHACVVQRRLLHRGRSLRAGYVEGVAVHAGHRGRGLGARLMDAVEHLVRGGYQLGALSSSEQALGFYAARGWQRWRGPTSVLGPGGPQPTPDDDGGVFVLPGSVPLALTGELTCDWRDGDVW